MYFNLMKTTVLQSFVIGVLVLLTSANGFGQGSFTFSPGGANGNWNASANWTLSSGTDADGIPDADDDVIIPNGKTVNINVSSACNAITLNGNATINFTMANQTLSVNGLMTMNGTSSVTGGSASRILDLLGDFVIPASQTGSIGSVSVTQAATKTFTITGTFTPNSATGTKTLGNVVINSTGTWRATSGETYATQNFTMNNGSLIDGNSTAIINIGGNFSVQPSTPGLHSKIGRITLNVAGSTAVTGYLEFANSSSGTKTFNNTITVSVGATWDNVIGEDPVINCSIVNNGLWPVPSGGTGQYNVSIAGTYSYSGTTEIGMTILSLQSASTVTNTGILRLTSGANNALTVTSGGQFINGDGTALAYLYLAGYTNNVSIGGGGSVNFTPANNTVDYNFNGDQNIYSTSYYNLTSSYSGTKTLTGSTNVSNSVNVTDAAIMDAQTNTLNGTGNLVMTGTSELKLSKVSATLPELTGTANSLAAGTTITFNGSGTQTAKGSSASNPSTTNTYPYQHVNISGNNANSLVTMTSVSLISGNLTFTNRGRMQNNPVMTVVGTFDYGSSGTTTVANNITVGNFIFSSGTLDYSNRTITVNGSDGTWTNNGGGSLVNASSTVIFTTGTNQQITGTQSTTFNNLTINNSNGVTLNGVNTQSSGTLTFTSGNLMTGSNFIYATGAVSRTSGFVQGNLRKDISSASPSKTFEVGTNTTYSPIDVVFTGVTVSGTLTASATAGDHPDVNGSNIEPNKTANRYWSLTQAGITFTSYSATFNFAAADLDGLANTSDFQIKRLNGINWLTTTIGTRTAASTQFTGEAAAKLPANTRQDFQCGEIITTTGVSNRVTGASNWSSASTWIQNRTGTMNFTNGNATVTGTGGTLFTTELVVGDVLMLQTSPSTIIGTVQSISSATSLTLTANATATGSGGYGRQYVPNSVNDDVTIGNSNITNAATTISLDMPAIVNTLNINTLASPRSTAHVLTHTGTNSLTVQSDVVVNQPGGGATDAWNINAGSAVVNGILTIGSADNTDNTRIAKVVITTGTVSVNNLVMSTGATNGREATAVLDMSGGASTITVRNSVSFTNNRGTLTPGTTSTFEYARSASGQRINWPGSNTTNSPTYPWIYNNLLLNNTSAAGAYLQAGDDISNTLSNARINVTGNIRVQTGLFLTNDNCNIAGSNTKTFQIDPGAVFFMDGNASTFPTGFQTFNLGTASPFGTVTYNQTNSLTVASQTFGILKLLGDATFTIPTLSVTGNLQVGNGLDNSITSILQGSNVTLTVTGDVTINSNGEIDANASTDITTITVGGNWVNNNVFTAGTRTVVFNGAGPNQPQTISGTSSDAFYNLTINGSTTAKVVTLLRNTTVTNTLTLTQGGIDLNSYSLNINRSATSAIGRTSGYIKSEKTSAPYGTINWFINSSTGSFVYPFGKSDTEYIPFTFNVTSAGNAGSGSGYVGVATYATASNNTPYPTGVTNLSGTSGGNSVVDRFWVITAGTTEFATTRPTATITFTAVGGSSPTTTPPSERPGTIPDLAAAGVSINAHRWSPANYWDVALPGQTFTNNAPSTGFFQVVVPNVNSFSPWALADVLTSLPVELVDFQATAVEDGVELNWQTLSELNNDFFLVERSGSGESFEEIAQVEGAGTTNKQKYYSLVDESVQAGRWYYRLRQTDYNGNFTFSNVVRVDVEEVIRWQIYPNPFDGSQINVKLSSSYLNKEAHFTIHDINGRKVYSSTATLTNSTLFTLQPNQKLEAGVYILSVIVDHKIERERVVVK